jgi:cardiolipin synthase
MSASSTSARTERLLTIPNLLSALRLCSVPVFLWLFVTGREEAGVIVYAVGAWTDFFDGIIARRYNQVSELGKVLDPLSDRIYVVALVIALVATGALAWPLAAAIVVRDATLLAAFPLLERRGVSRIPVNYVGKTATGMLFFGLTSLAYSQTDFPVASLADEVGTLFVVLGTILYYVSATMYVREALDRIRSMKEDTRRL